MLRTGWLFTGDRTLASVGVDKIAVGSTAFPLGQERPSWLDLLLRETVERIGVARDEHGETLARRWLDASLSDDPEQRRRVAQAREALTAAFGLPRLETVRTADEVARAFGPALWRARQLGPAAERALSLVADVFLQGRDILVVPYDPGAAARAWLGECTEGDGAPLEQVLVLGDG